jgi:hypothetical protein
LNKVLVTVCLTALFARNDQFMETIRDCPLFRVKHGMKAGKLLKRVHQVAEKADFDDAKQCLAAAALDLLHRQQANFQTRHHAYNPEFRMALVELLCSPLTYSANLSDLPRIEKLLVQIPNLDRQVANHGLTTVELLQRAWVDVDIYNYVATQMKYVAKISYALMLILGYAVTLITITSLNEPDFITSNHARYMILALSVAVTLLSAFITFVNPVTKWHKLRSSALALESEIWKFRAGADMYSRTMITTTKESLEDTLQDFVAMIEDAVLKSAGISDSSFLSQFSFGSQTPQQMKAYKHGQYGRAGLEGSLNVKNPTFMDDHHSPLTADVYIALRMEPLICVYQKRLPTYARQLQFSQAISVFGGIAVMLLVYFDVSAWSAVSTGAVAALSAYTEFSDTEKKLRRYSDTVQQAHRVLLWWHALSSIQQTASFNLLVERCETCFASERSAWVSSMASQKQLVKQLDKDLSVASDDVTR